MSASERNTTLERLLDLAWRRFTERGYAGTSMADLATELGMSKRTVYELVPDKRTLLLRAAFARLDAVDAEAGAILDAGEGARATFQRLTALAIRAYRDTGPALLHELPRREPDAWHAIEERRNALVRRHLERVVERADRDGAPVVARAIATAIAGLLAHHEAKGPGADVEQDLEALTDVMGDGLFGAPTEPERP